MQAAIRQEDEAPVVFAFFGGIGGYCQVEFCLVLEIAFEQVAEGNGKDLFQLRFVLSHADDGIDCQEVVHQRVVLDVLESFIAEQYLGEAHAEELEVFVEGVAQALQEGARVAGAGLVKLHHDGGEELCVLWQVLGQEALHEVHDDLFLRPLQYELEEPLDDSLGVDDAVDHVLVAFGSEFLECNVGFQGRHAVFAHCFRHREVVGRRASVVSPQEVYHFLPGGRLNLARFLLESFEKRRLHGIWQLHENIQWQ